MKYIYIVLIAIKIVFLSSCIDLDKADRAKRQQLDKEFLRIPRDSSFIGIVDTSFTSVASTYRATLYISLKDGKKFATAAVAMPKDVYGRWEIPSYVLVDFLQKGDTIYKPRGKDSLFVLKNDLIFRYFLITKEFSDSVFHR